MSINLIPLFPIRLVAMRNGQLELLSMDKVRPHQRTQRLTHNDTDNKANRSSHCGKSLLCCLALTLQLVPPLLPGSDNAISSSSVARL